MYWKRLWPWYRCVTFFLDPTPMSRHSYSLEVKRAVWASVSELPQARPRAVSSLAAHSFPSKLMTTESALCKPIKVDKKTQTLHFQPTERAQKRESRWIHLLSSGVSLWKLDLHGIRQSNTCLFLGHACSNGQLAWASKPQIHSNLIQNAAHTCSHVKSKQRSVFFLRKPL